MHGSRVVLIVVWCLLASGPLVAQHPVLVRHYSLETMDIGVIADAVRGVSLVAAPSLRTRQGGQSTKITWLRFAPDSLLQWLDSADVYLRAPIQTNEPDGTRWTPELMVIDHSGGLTFGRRIHKHRLAKQRYVRLADSMYSWRFEVSGEQVDGLRHLLLEAASAARLTTANSTPTPGASCDNSDQPVVVEYQPTPTASGAEGRVAMQYVVDTTGRADMGTFVALFATTPSLEDAARDLIAQSRFKPAMLQGRPVCRLVQQVAVWR
jgi:hypothetical protein